MLQAIIFMAEGWAAYAALSFVTVALIFLSQVPPLTVLKFVNA